MMIVRPVATSDHSEILALAREAGIGMTSLPPDAEVLEQKIARSVASFSGKPELGKRASISVRAGRYRPPKKLVGTTGIVAHVGPEATRFIPTSFRPSCRPRAISAFIRCSACCTWSTIIPARPRSARCSCCPVTAATASASFSPAAVTSCWPNSRRYFPIR